MKILLYCGASALLLAGALMSTALLTSSGGRGGRSGERTDGRDAASALSAPEQSIQNVFLVPYLSGSGVPVVVYRADAGIDWPFMSPEVGVPFGTPDDPRALTPFPPNVAVWADGVVVWSEPWDHPKECYEGRLEHKTVQRLLNAITKKKYWAPSHVRYSEQERDMPGSTIVVLDGKSRFGIRSGLDSMELTKEYWYWSERDGLKDYPFEKYTFEQFCQEVPNFYADYLRDFADLRAQLRSVIPVERKRIDIRKRLRWVVLPAPKGI